MSVKLVINKNDLMAALKNGSLLLTLVVDAKDGDRSPVAPKPTSSEDFSKGGAESTDSTPVKTDKKNSAKAASSTKDDDSSSEEVVKPKSKKDESESEATPKKTKKEQDDDSSPAKKKKDDSESDATPVKKVTKATKKDESESDESKPKKKASKKEESESDETPVKGKKSKKDESESDEKKTEESDASEPPKEKGGKTKEPKEKKVDLVVVNQSQGKYEDAPKYYTFAKGTNLLVYKKAIIGGFGKDGIRTLNSRDVTSAETRGWKVDKKSADEIKKLMKSLKD